MLNVVSVTQLETIQTWNNWIVAVPDDMDDECIEELMREMVCNCNLDLDHEEHVDYEVRVDIADAPVGATTPDLTLTDDGLVDEDAILTAFTTDRLQAELDRRRTKDSDIIVV